MRYIIIIIIISCYYYYYYEFAVVEYNMLNPSTATRGRRCICRSCSRHDASLCRNPWFLSPRHINHNTNNTDNNDKHLDLDLGGFDSGRFLSLRGWNSSCMDRQLLVDAAEASNYEQSPNHRHRNLKAFKKHIQKVCPIVLLQRNICRTFLG